MSKAINWPEQFLNEVNKENTTDIRIAFRPGSIYYDHCYYVADEVVDIRVNHKIIRPGIIVGDLKLCKIKDLSDDDMAKQKEGLKSVDDIVKYLAETYNQEVSPESEITVVYYRNLDKPADEDKVDDPHM